jgi:hypothetical protein
MTKCPKCNAELTTCLCCAGKTLCRRCKACYGYKGMFRMSGAIPVKAIAADPSGRVQ